MPMVFKRKMPIPKVIKEQFPISENLIELKDERDKEIADILSGKSNKIIVLVGPCSADREKPVLEYVCRLSRLQEKVSDKLLIIPRVYTNKPRTKCDGYMGMIYQPDPDKEEDILEGIISVRKLHLNVINESGLTSADEMLYPEDFRYISDIVSYIAIGARSVENQQHRLTASGLDIPVGIKNPTSGNIDVMLNSIMAAQNGHKFLYRGWEVESEGNLLAHAVLRGYVNMKGENMANYHYENIERLYGLYVEKKLANPAVIIDMNHSNSDKRPVEQIRICKEVLEYRKYSSAIQSFVKGFMIESYIQNGNQPSNGTNYGKSITDACLGWDDTERLLYEIAEKI